MINKEIVLFIKTWNKTHKTLIHVDVRYIFNSRSLCLLRMYFHHRNIVLTKITSSLSPNSMLTSTKREKNSNYIYIYISKFKYLK